jgi:hypothetical protein
MRCSDVQAQPPRSSSGAPHSAPRTSNCDRGDPESPFSAQKAGEPTAGWCFHTQTWPLLIKMATCQLVPRMRHEAAAARPMATPVPQQSTVS